MKKITFLLSAVLVSTSLNAQIFSDDFESYTVGQYVGPTGPEWTTWSGTEGGAEDVQVTNAQASSGSNSIYFSSTATGGGPQDVLLDFGQQYTDGVFTFQSDFFVEAGKNAYFNFQGTTAPGTTWSLNCNMVNGLISLDDGLTPNLALSTYTDDTWLTLRIEANLSTGRWVAFVDGTCIGTWANGVNQIASLDLFPILNSGYYVDDISFDHQAYTLPNLNAALAGIDMGGIIVGIDVYPTVKVTNAGVADINSFDVTIDYNGNQYTETVTGQTLTSLSSMDVTFTNSIALVPGEMAATPTVSNVNGMTDDDATDDSACGTIDPVVPAPGKVVVGEEGTGTWCPWCVRGTVFMDRFEHEYGPFWAGIAVHNGDPMVNAGYDTAIGALISGYPSALVDRGAEVDPSGMTNDFFARLETAPAAFITNTSTWNSNTRELTVTVTADFQMAANSNWRLACVITEDGVTGTDSGYNQANAYAGGSNGVMGGFELLPSPVPAAQMVYDHVAREILPSFAGDANSFPATVNIGEQHSKTFTFTLDQAWDENNIHIIGLLIDPSGMIDNAGKAAIGSDTGVNELSGVKSFRVYPNPAETFAMVDLELENDSDVELRLLDMSGKVVNAQGFDMLNASSAIQINTIGLEAGVYLVELTINNTRMVKRLSIK